MHVNDKLLNSVCLCLSLIYVSVSLRLSLRFCVFLQKSVPALTFSADSNAVVTCSTDGTVKAWNINGMHLIMDIKCIGS